jgi:hypothetical protein
MPQYTVTERNKERIENFLKSMSPDNAISERHYYYDSRKYTFDEALAELLTKAGF